jgi:hypothetical protein
MIFRLGCIDDVRDRDTVARARREFRQFGFTRGEAEHRRIDRIGRKTMLDLHHQAREMHADRLYGAARTIAGVLHGPGIDAEPVN